MDNATTLAIDTAGPRLQIGLFCASINDANVDEIATGHAEIIFDRIGQMLKKHGLAYTDLTRIAVTTGPGSFTGLRIGLSAARGLGLGLGLPVIGVPTLLAMSLTIAKPQGFTIVCDARRDEAYVQDFVGPAQPETAARLVPLQSADAIQADRRVSPRSVDILALARFAHGVNPENFPPHPFYIRDADAKPQIKGKVAHAKEPIT